MTASSDLFDPIGGFFGLEDPGSGDLLAMWGARDAPALVNATSALAMLVSRVRPGAVWLPGYVCAELVGAVPTPARRFFPLDDDLAPDIAALEGRIAPGDMVLAVNMFGRAPGPGWQSFAAAHPGVTFVEDCAQALDTGVPAWGDWRLYSPRKLVGVPEGGLLVAVSGRARAQSPGLEPAPHAGADGAEGRARRLAPMLARRSSQSDNSQWPALHHAAEASHSISAAPMSAFARTLLAGLDPAPMIAARKRNFAHLSVDLHEHAVLPEVDPRFAPSGFPVGVAPDVRDEVLANLHAHRIFAAVHWRDIPAPEAFASDHIRAKSLITLPCDHRYGAAEMARVAEVFRAAVRGRFGSGR